MAKKLTALEFSNALRASIRVPSQIAAPLAKQISQDIQQNFTLGQDPYEKSWKGLAVATKKKGRTDPALDESGAGKRSVKVKPSKDAGIVITVGKEIMKFHQTGASKGNWKLPRRSFLPIGTLPKTWRLYWDALLAKGLRKKLEGR
jgi:phage gpG-like protein